MCGFLAIFGEQLPPLAPEQARVIARSIAHRGPDDFQRVVGPHHHAMFWRLSIVDQVGGKQPMVSSDQQTTLLFNGEVYNYRALRRELQQDGVVFRTESDTEVLLEAYRQWGLSCLRRFEGMFALCVIDHVTQTVVLARDRLGVKPLYFAQQPFGWIVASEQKAILAYQQTAPRLDRNSLLQYLVFQTIPQTGTMFEGIMKVPPGTCMTFTLPEGTPVRVEPIGPVAATFGAESYEEYRRIGHDLICEQTRLALETDLPICFHLSGGLDSNTLIGLCRTLYPGRPFVCVSSFIEGSQDPEWAVIREAAAHHGGTFRSVTITANHFWNIFEQVIYHLDEPVGDPGVVAQFLVNALANEESKIVYSGQGFDELFFGYIRDLVAYIQSTFGIEALQVGSDRYQSLPVTSRQFLKGWEDFLASIRAVPHLDPALACFRKLCRFDPLGGISGEEAVFFQRARHIAMNQYLALKQRAPSLHEFLLAAETTIQLPSLLHMEDRASMCYSLETRVPFCTASILDFARAGRLEWKFRNGEPKGLLRDLFQSVLPPVIAKRKEKIGRPMPFRRWLDGERGAPYRAMAERYREALRELTGIDFVGYALRQNRPYDRSAWAVVSLATWMDLYKVVI